MNEHEQPMGVDPKIKKEINEEWFEGDAAVLIGKKEDMLKLLEKLAPEEKTEQLSDYIKEVLAALSRYEDLGGKTRRLSE